MKQEYVFEKVSDHIQAIDSPTGEIQYLIEGENQALLMDTGSGFLNMKEIVSQHTDLPLQVVLTHGHPDHAFGIQGFEKVYMNDRDIPLYRQNAAADFQKGFIEGSMGRAIADEEVNPAPVDFAFEQVQEGDVFDLGGVHVRIYEIPGHTAGSIVLLVEEDGVLITGDSANTNTWLFLPESTSVEEYRDNLQALLDRAGGKYHRVFTTHRDVDTSPRLLEEGIALCNEVLAGTNQPVPVVYLGQNALVAKEANEDLTLNDGTCFNLAYNPDKIFRS